MQPNGERRPCPRCGRHTLTPWYLRRDRERRVWRRWVCVHCQAHQDVPEDASALSESDPSLEAHPDLRASLAARFAEAESLLATG